MEASLFLSLYWALSIFLYQFAAAGVIRSTAIVADGVSIGLMISLEPSTVTVAAEATTEINIKANSPIPISNSGNQISPVSINTVVTLATPVTSATDKSPLDSAATNPPISSNKKEQSITDSTALSARTESAFSKKEASATDSAAPSAQTESAVSKKEASATDSAAPPAQTESAVSEKEASTTDSAARLTQTELAISKKEASITDSAAPSAQTESAISKKEASVADSAALPTQSESVIGSKSTMTPIMTSTQVVPASAVDSTAAFTQVPSTSSDNRSGVTMSLTTSTLPPLRTTHRVEVGPMGQFLFQPSQVNAEVGDIVEFSFRSFNHTLTQSSLEKPCVSNGGFNSGFRQFNPSNSPLRTLSFSINDLDPQYFFCLQQNPVEHCEKGMVFAINPGETMQDFLSNVKSSSESVVV